MKYVTVAEIAAQCGVTPQGVNAYLRKSGLQKQAVKNGNKFLLDENLAETVRNHFGVTTFADSEAEAETTTEIEKIETFTETSKTKTETVSDVSETDKTAAKSAEAVLIEDLRAQIEELREDRRFLREQNTSLLEQNAQLIESVNRLTESNKALTATNALHVASDKRDILLIDGEGANSATPQHTTQKDEEVREGAADQPNGTQEQEPQGLLGWLRKLFS